MKTANWYVITQANVPESDRTILAVYGSALGDEATVNAREMSRLGPVALRLVATRKRPAVGGKVPKRSLSMSFEDR